jgi:hypothetical protein
MLLFLPIIKTRPDRSALFLYQFAGFANGVDKNSPTGTEQGKYGQYIR